MAQYATILQNKKYVYMSPNPPPYNADVKNGWSYASIRLIELLDVDRDKFTFPSYVIKSVL